MGIQFFNIAATKPKQVHIPVSYGQKRLWQPRIGDIFPDFQADTTHGPIRLFDWAEGAWSFLFSHPIAFSPVCTTEMIALANAREEFRACNTKILGFSASTVADQLAWHQDIEKRFGYHVEFPAVEDVDGHFSEAFAMNHPKESSSLPIRKSFILDPQMRIRMIFEYPLYAGRSTEEVLRTIEALQAVDEYGVATPADWHPGEHYLYSERAAARFPKSINGSQVQNFSPYLSFIEPGALPQINRGEGYNMMDELCVG